MAMVVLEDGHVLGSQIVTLLLRSAGYRLSDWGSRRKPAEVATLVQAEGTEVLFCSTLMLRSALQVAELRRLLQEAGQHPVLVVGGAPFRLDPRLADEVGADYYGASAGDVLDIVTRIRVAR
jgi:methylmalonyl-CoA mutase cobalamin-binding domain/chain